jgi:hypothetical protein
MGAKYGLGTGVKKNNLRNAFILEIIFIFTNNNYYYNGL